MAPRTSRFLATGVPDARLAQSAATALDATERQVMDQQVVDVQTVLSQLLANGIVGSYVQIDPSSPVDVAKGDVLCRSAVLTRATAVLATTTNLAAAGGSVLGVALEAVTKGSRCPYAVAGAVPPGVTGLLGVAAPSLVRVSSAARAESVFAYGATDTPLGGMDSSGWLSLAPGGVSPQTGTGTFRGSATTTDATPTAIIDIPFGDDAVLTGELSLLALTPGVGVFQAFSAGGIYYTIGGVLQAPAGTPTNNSFTTYGGGPPTADQVYDNVTKVLSFRVIGIAATNITWLAVVADSLIIIT